VNYKSDLSDHRQIFKCPKPATEVRLKTAFTRHTAPRSSAELSLSSWLSAHPEDLLLLRGQDTREQTPRGSLPSAVADPRTDLCCTTSSRCPSGRAAGPTPAPAPRAPSCGTSSHYQRGSLAHSPFKGVPGARANQNARRSRAGTRDITRTLPIKCGGSRAPVCGGVRGWGALGLHGWLLSCIVE